MDLDHPSPTPRTPNSRVVATQFDFLMVSSLSPNPCLLSPTQPLPRNPVFSAPIPSPNVQGPTFFRGGPPWLEIPSLRRRHHSMPRKGVYHSPPTWSRKGTSSYPILVHEYSRRHRGGLAPEFTAFGRPRQAGGQNQRDFYREKSRRRKLNPLPRAPKTANHPKLSRRPT
jgi:hypothetical protein